MEQVPHLPQRLDEQPYFHRWVHRADTTDVLLENGDFLLRRTKSGTSEKLAVSVYWMREIRHFPLQRTPEGRYCFESRGFRLVKDLIRWHQSTKIPLTEESGVIVKSPKAMADWELLTPQIQLEEEAIAWGRYGDVCEAKLLLRKTGTERSVAVKSVVLGEQTEEHEKKEARERLLHEARCLRELSDHAHIVRIHGVTVDSLQPMMAVELMSGNLLDRLRDKPHLSADSKRKLARMAIGAVVHMHCHGMIHRHICAKNCLVRTTASYDTFNLKLTGFDFCEKLEGEEEYVDKAMPPLNMSVCAPEALACKTWSKASDIWSFAVFEYELFTNGAIPYAAELAKAQSNWTSRANILLALFQAGSRLPVPLEAPIPVQAHWRACFENEPKSRPTAFALMEQLSADMSLSDK